MVMLVSVALHSTPPPGCWVEAFKWKWLDRYILDTAVMEINGIMFKADIIKELGRCTTTIAFLSQWWQGSFKICKFSVFFILRFIILGNSTNLHYHKSLLKLYNHLGFSVVVRCRCLNNWHFSQQHNKGLNILLNILNKELHVTESGRFVQFWIINNSQLSWQLLTKRAGHSLSDWMNYYI